MWARFSETVHTGPGAHAISCTIGTGTFPGVMRLERGAESALLSRTEIKERVELYLQSSNPSDPSWPVLR